MIDISEFERLARDFQIEPAGRRGVKQTEESFWADLGDGPREISLHDYDALYATPWLYEAVLYGALGCRSPFSVIEILQRAAAEGLFERDGLRVLETGAGSGLFGALLRERLSPARLVGLDLSPVARKAAETARPGLYDRYVTADLAALETEEADLRAEAFTLVGGVSATGPGHIPPQGLDNALDLLAPGGLFLFHARADDGNLGPEGVNIYAQWYRRRAASGALETVLAEPCFHRRAADGREIYYEIRLARKRA